MGNIDIKIGKTYKFPQFKATNNRTEIVDATIVDYKKNIGQPDTVKIKLSSGQLKTISVNIFKSKIRTVMNETNQLKSLSQRIDESFNVNEAVKYNDTKEYKDIFNLMTDGRKIPQNVIRQILPMLKSASQEAVIDMVDTYIVPKKIETADIKLAIETFFKTHR